MKKIIHCYGIVSDLRHTSDMQNHCALFSLKNEKILLKISEPIFLHNGDCVTVVGFNKNGVFHALTYYNYTKKILGEAKPGLGLLIFLIPFFIAGLFTLIFGIGLIFLGIASYLTYKAILNINANKIIKELALTPNKVS